MKNNKKKNRTEDLVIAHEIRLALKKAKVFAYNKKEDDNDKESL